MTRSDDGDPRIDGLSGRLDGLSGVQETPEDEKEAIRQQREAQLIEILESDHGQARLLKGIATVGVALFILSLGIMLMVLFAYIMSGAMWPSSKDIRITDGAQLLPWALFASLLFSITTVTVALLIGVFRSTPASVIENLLTHGGRGAASGAGATSP